MRVCLGETFISFMAVIALQSQYHHLLRVSFRGSVESSRIHSLQYITSLVVFQTSASSKEEMFEFCHNHKFTNFYCP